MNSFLSRVLPYSSLINTGSFALRVNLPSVLHVRHQFNDSEKAEKSRKAKSYISLIGLDKTHSYVTLEEATKLATRRGLNLIKVSDYDRKRDCPVYEVQSKIEPIREDINKKKSSKIKDQKLMAISYKISDNDLHNKSQQILKWLAKNYEVKVTISGTQDSSVLESVFRKVSSNISQEGRIHQKVITGQSLRTTITPPKR